jgi:hypothetical protein
MSPRDGTRQPPRCRTHVPEPGPRFPASGISARKARCPARLPRIRFDSRSWANWFAGHHHRGACAGLSTVAFPEHPSAGEMTRGLVQAGGLTRRSTLQLVRPCGVPRVQRQDASNPLLQPTFRVTSTRDKHHLWRLPAESAVGNPPTSSTSRPTAGESSVSAVSSEDGAGPPCGHPASNSSVLDGTSPASGRPTAHLHAFALWSGASRAPQLSRLQATPPDRTL